MSAQQKRKFPVQQGKKSFKRSVIEHMEETHKDVLSIKKDMRKEAKEIIDKEIGGRFALMEFCLREVRLFAELLVEKGMVSQREISQKRDKIRREEKNGR